MFVKKSMEIDHSRKTPTFDPFQYDPLEDITRPIITHGVLQCPIYETGENYLKPAFLQSEIDTNILKIIGSNSNPLTIIFADGFKFGEYGKFTRRFNSFTIKINQIIPIEVVYSSYVYSQYNAIDDSIEFGLLNINSNNVTYDIAEPTSKNVNDHWFDIQNNQMKYWKWDIQEEIYRWFDITRTFLGKVLVNDTFKIYQIETWYPNKTMMSIGYYGLPHTFQTTNINCYFTNSSNIVECLNESDINQINIGDWIWSSQDDKNCANKVISKNIIIEDTVYELILEKDYIGTTTSNISETYLNKIKDSNTVTLEV